MDALAQLWTDHTSYAFPPFALIGRFFQKLCKERVERLIAPVWRAQLWFPVLLSMLVGLPLELSRSAVELSTGATPSSSQQPSHPSCLAFVRCSLSERGVPEEACEIICSSWRQSTNKSYGSAWNKWAIWCNISHVSAPLNILNDTMLFLSILFKEGKEYSTVNTYQSMISGFHTSIDGVVVRKHPLVCRLQGIFNSRPSKPRYKSVWSVSSLLLWDQSLPSLPDLSLRD